MLQIAKANVAVVHVMAARLACRIYAPGGRLAVQITEANVTVVHVMAARLACNIYRENARTQINQTHNQHKRVPMLEHLRRTCANNGLAGPQWVLKDASSTRKTPKHENVMVTYFPLSFRRSRWRSRWQHAVAPAKHNSYTETAFKCLIRRPRCVRKPLLKKRRPEGRGLIWGTVQ